MAGNVGKSHEVCSCLPFSCGHVINKMGEHDRGGHTPAMKTSQ